MLHAVLLVGALSAACGANMLPASSSGGLELVVLHNNDMHARFEQTARRSGVCNARDREEGRCYGGFARVAYLVKKARADAESGAAPPVLYLNAGDTYTGTAWFAIFKWQIAAQFLNVLKPDAVSLGNHEFDNGVSGLTPFIENLTVPVLAANLDLQHVPELAAERNLLKSLVFTIKGVQVGVIGYLTPDTKFLSIRNDVEYEDEVVAIRREVNELQKRGVKILIALGHSGWATDLRIAKDVEGIDLVIGGHTNTFLWNGTAPDVETIQGPYPTMVKQASGRMVPAVQAYAYTKYLGKLNLKFDEDGELISYDGSSPILLDNTIPQDPEVLQIINKYRAEVERISEEVVGTTAVLLDATICRLHECNLGNLIADAIVYHYAINFNGTRWTDASIAVVQGGGIRTSIDIPGRPGNVTRGDLLAVMPFDMPIVTVTMDGTQLLEFIEHSVSGYNPMSPTGQFLQFSGVRVTYDLARPVGQRIASIAVRCWDCFVPQFYQIDSWRTYKVLMPQFLAEGGDGFSMLVDLPRETLSWKDIDATADYIARRSPVYPEVADRVVLINEDQLVVPEVPEEEELGAGGGNSGAGTQAASLSAVCILTVLSSFFLR